MSLPAPGTLFVIKINNQPFGYCRLESLEPNFHENAHIEGWFDVKLLIFALPLLITKYTLSSSHLEGEEFSIQGIPYTLVKLPLPGGIKELPSPYSVVDAVDHTDEPVGILNPEIVDSTKVVDMEVFRALRKSRTFDV